MEITSSNTINGDRLFNYYDSLKSKYRFKYDENMYSTMAWNSLLSMFEYDDKLFRPDLFDKILHDFGIVAVIKTDTAEYTPVVCNLVDGERYADGFFKDSICYDLRGKEYQFKSWRENSDILVFFNNSTLTSDIFIDKYSYMLSEIDRSIISNVIFSRLKPIPVAKDGQTKAKIDAILDDLMNGKLKTIISDLNISDIVESNKPSIEVLNLTEVESSKYIQYLQHLHDSMVARLYFMMGLSISDSGKQAQLSIEELNKSKSASISLSKSWYNMRKKGFEIAEKKTGLEWHFDFSDVWRNEIESAETKPEDVELNSIVNDKEDVELNSIVNDKGDEEDE